MDTNVYLPLFQQAVDQLDRTQLNQKQLQAETGIWLDTVILRIQKQHWANNPDEKPQTGSAIFFSIWINDDDTREPKLFYNIHALKLRKLNGYVLTSRKFADDFREQFNDLKHDWPNVSMNFGPQTLMQGWQPVNLEYLVNDILKIANKFTEIDFIIDTLLNSRKVI